jgi:hypothetical protein
MRVRLATAVSLLVFACGAFGAMSSTATARPLLCEKSGCGGPGAREYSERYAKEGRGFEGANEMRFIETSGCEKNTQYGAQWDCWGWAWDEVDQLEWKWHMWVGEYGGFKHALWN